MQVSFTVTNTGSREGAEVAQVYVGPLPTPVATPVRQLAGFSKVQLAPGASTKVSIEIDPRSVSYFSNVENAWVTPLGPVDIYVGDSSRSTKLTAKIGEQDFDSSEKTQVAPTSSKAGLSAVPSKGR